MAIRAESRPETMRSAAQIMALLLVRVIVPLWLLVGAVLKLVDASPSHLPAALIKAAGPFGIDLRFLLHFSIGVELAVAGAMWLLPRVARLVGLVMLGLFLPVLLGDVLTGASSCGCFGAVQVHPGITLSMDLMFFLGLLFFGRGVPGLQVPDALDTRRVLLAGVWTVVSFAIGFGVTPMFAGGGTGVAVEQAPAVGAVALPEEGYYMPDYGEWIGQRFGELPLAAWIQGGSAEMSPGRSYVLLYRKDCEHCHELMEVFFSGQLAWPTLAIAVPERGGFPTENVQPMPCQECRTARLPSGVDWFFQTPVLIRLQDGVVECASESSAADPRCLDW